MPRKKTVTTANVPKNRSGIPTKRNVLEPAKETRARPTLIPTESVMRRKAEDSTAAVRNLFIGISKVTDVRETAIQIHVPTQKRARMNVTTMKRKDSDAAASKDMSGCLVHHAGRTCALPTHAPASPIPTEYAQSAILPTRAVAPKVIHGIPRKNPVLKETTDGTENN